MPHHYTTTLSHQNPIGHHDLVIRLNDHPGGHEENPPHNLHHQRTHHSAPLPRISALNQHRHPLHQPLDHRIRATLSLQTLRNRHRLQVTPRPHLPRNPLDALTLLGRPHRGAELPCYRTISAPVPLASTRARKDPHIPACPARFAPLRSVRLRFLCRVVNILLYSGLVEVREHTFNVLDMQDCVSFFQGFNDAPDDPLGAFGRCVHRDELEWALGRGGGHCVGDALFAKRLEFAKLCYNRS